MPEYALAGGSHRHAEADLGAPLLRTIPEGSHHAEQDIQQEEGDARHVKADLIQPTLKELVPVMGHRENILQIDITHAQLLLHLLPEIGGESGAVRAGLHPDEGVQALSDPIALLGHLVLVHQLIVSVIIAGELAVTLFLADTTDTVGHAITRALVGDIDLLAHGRRKIAEEAVGDRTRHHHLVVTQGVHQLRGGPALCRLYVEHLEIGGRYVTHEAITDQRVLPERGVLVRSPVMEMHAGGETD